MVERLTRADSEAMKNVLAVAITWIALVAGFLASADAIPWHVSFPVIGFLWVFVPVAIAGRARSIVGVVSLATFASILTGFLVLFWLVLAFMAGIGTTILGLDLSASRAVADLTTAGVSGVIGALLGWLAGGRIVPAARARSDEPSR